MSPQWCVEWRQLPKARNSPFSHERLTNTQGDTPLLFTNSAWVLNVPQQRAKKVVSDGLGLVDFVIMLVIFVLNLPNGQVLLFGEIQITEGL